MQIKRLNGEIIYENDDIYTEYTIEDALNKDITDFSYADLQDKSLVSVIFENCDFTGANLSNANLHNAAFKNCKLKDINLTNAFLVNIHGVPYKVIDNYVVSVIDTFIAIGCKCFSVTDWQNFTDDEISTFAKDALNWWNSNKQEVFNFYNNNKYAAN